MKVGSRWVVRALVVLAAATGCSSSASLSGPAGDPSVGTDRLLEPSSAAGEQSGAQAVGSHERYVLVVRRSDLKRGAAASYDRCTQSVVLSEPLGSTSATASATVTGRREAYGVRDCLNAVPGITATLRPLVARRGLATTWRGATIVRVGSKESGRRLDSAQAGELFRVLSRRTPETSSAPSCPVQGTVWRVAFDGAEDEQVRIQVPDVCGPVLEDGHRYLLDDTSRAAVGAAFTDAEAVR